MIEVERPADLAQYVGKEIGVSDWFTVDQAIIDKFADATGDHQWIHVDVERAKREMPGGKTIAHGYLTLSLVPRLGRDDLPRQEALARAQLRLEPGALHRAGAGRLAHPAAPEDQIGRAGRGRRRAHHLGKHDRGRGCGAPGAGRRNHQHAVRIGGPIRGSAATGRFEDHSISFSGTGTRRSAAGS